jgi:hypothetical protein
MVKTGFDPVLHDFLQLLLRIRRHLHSMTKPKQQSIMHAKLDRISIGHGGVARLPLEIAKALAIVMTILHFRKEFKEFCEPIRI